MKVDLKETDRLLARIDTEVSKTRLAKAVEDLMDSAADAARVCTRSRDGVCENCHGSEYPAEYTYGLYYDVQSAEGVPNFRGDVYVWHDMHEMVPAGDANNLSDQKARYSYEAIEKAHERRTRT